MKQDIYINDLLGYTGELDLRLTLIAGQAGLDKKIPESDVNRPGLSIAGFFDFFAYDRIQIFGKGETAYLHKIGKDEQQLFFDKFFSYDILCCVFTHSDEPPKEFIDLANKKNVPVFISECRTTRFISLITHIIEDTHAPVATIHGTLVDVSGLGVLLLGKSGVGKSETALELIERGHRLVADDIVEMKRIQDTILIGSGSSLIRHHLEIRGLGILNVKDIYGISSVRNKKRIELVVSMEIWNENKNYDRLGIDDDHYTILDIDLPHVTIPVRPGRNIPVLVETAALNQRLKKMGVFSARELDKKIQDWMNMESGTNNG